MLVTEVESIDAQITALNEQRARAAMREKVDKYLQDRIVLLETPFVKSLEKILLGKINVSLADQRRQFRETVDKARDAALMTFTDDLRRILFPQDPEIRESDLEFVFRKALGEAEGEPPQSDRAKAKDQGVI